MEVSGGNKGNRETVIAKNQNNSTQHTNTHNNNKTNTKNVSHNYSGPIFSL